MKVGFSARWSLALIMLSSACPLLISPPKAYADGGAPNLAYVSGTARGVSVIDIAQQKVTNNIALPGDPHTILLSTDGRLLYTTQPALGSVTVFAPKNNQAVCHAKMPGHPTLLTLDPGTNTLYAASNDANSVTALNPMTCAILRTLHVHNAVYGLAVAVIGAGISGGSGNQIWVADSDRLYVFDASGKQLTMIPIPSGPHYLCIPAGSTAYITTGEGNIEAVDVNSWHILPMLLRGGTFGPMDYDAITGEVYVPDMQHNAIDVLTPISSGVTTLPHEPVQLLHFAAAPQSIAITSDGQFGFVALNNGSVVMLDIPGRQVVNTFQVGGTPHFIITGLYPSLLSLTPQQSTLLSIITDYSHYAAILVILLVFIVLVLRSKRSLPTPKPPQSH